MDYKELKKAIKRAGFKQIEIANLIDRNLRTFNGILNNKRDQYLNTHDLELIARKLNVDIVFRSDGGVDIVEG